MKKMTFMDSTDCYWSSKFTQNCTSTTHCGR